MFVADNDIVGIVTNHLVTNHWHLVVSDIAAADATTTIAVTFTAWQKGDGDNDDISR
jgi:hypothetical protein